MCCVYTFVVGFVYVMCVVGYMGWVYVCVESCVGGIVRWMVHDECAMCICVCCGVWYVCLRCMWHVRCVYNVCSGCICVSCMWDLSPVSTPYAFSIFRTHCEVPGLTLAPTNEGQRISAKAFNSKARWQLALLSALGCSGSKGHTARLHAIPSITFQGQYSYLHPDEIVKTHECLAPYPWVWSGQNLNKGSRRRFHTTSVPASLSWPLLGR